MQIGYTLFLFIVIMMLSLVGCASYPNPTSPPHLTLYPPSTPNPGVTPAATAVPSLETIKGSFRNQINILEKDMPRSNSQGYAIPTDQEQADFAKLTARIMRGDMAQAAGLAISHDYTLNY